MTYSKWEIDLYMHILCEFRSSKESPFQNVLVHVIILTETKTA